MKKILYILSAATMAILAVLCEKFLDSSCPSTFNAADV